MSLTTPPNKPEDVEQATVCNHLHYCCAQHCIGDEDKRFGDPALVGVCEECLCKALYSERAKAMAEQREKDARIAENVKEPSVDDAPPIVNALDPAVAAIAAFKATKKYIAAAIRKEGGA